MSLNLPGYFPLDRQQSRAIVEHKTGVTAQQNSRADVSVAVARYAVVANLKKAKKVVERPSSKGRTEKRLSRKSNGFSRLSL